MRNAVFNKALNFRISRQLHTRNSQILTPNAVKTVPQVTPLSKILIANRGEIACRVMRTARRLGIQTVAVYSDADRNSMHVSMADTAVHLGPAASTESYLRKDRVLEAAFKTGAQAIHPGYGFLSENVEFAEECAKEGVIFIGPPASAIRDMGIKSTSKHIMSAAGVPVINGYHGEDQSVERLRQEAENIGYPLMIKAVRGGGGKGMRICPTAADFDVQLESAKREAQKSFGDEVMLLERYVERPRHVEVQVFGDKYNNYVYLFERDCSVQRRHQKIIEEAPGPGIHAETRAKLGDAAVRAAQAVGYVGAGTVEFIMDAQQNFFFMEMNTRLQVEHPVSEMITGTDLVEWQLRVAAGEPLPLNQSQIKLNGHSFEARIYAEEPGNNFLPGAGPLRYLTTPQPSSDVRIETGVSQGDEVSVHYDPMIAKLVVWSQDRSSALRKLRSCLSEYNIVGLNTNVDFLMQLSAHEKFVEGDVHTDFIEQHHDELFPKRAITDQLVSQAVLASLLNQIQASSAQQRLSCDPHNPFTVYPMARLNHSLQRNLKVKSHDATFDVQLTYDGGNYQIKVGDGNQLNVSAKLSLTDNVHHIELDADGQITKSRVVFMDNDVYVFTKDGSFCFSMETPAFLTSQIGSSVSDGGAVAPMPGIIEKIMVADGEQVVKGQPLLVMIAMKMEYVIRAPEAGIVKKVFYKVGDNVAKNAALVKFELAVEN
uniref:EOG090X02EP n=1 Tax=Evadne anonyx TaxID=141404 RepID=A0A9N6ZDY2_9CRUS|nr:EOG090X02EP [Evadne anonyx]